MRNFIVFIMLLTAPVIIGGAWGQDAGVDAMTRPAENIARGAPYTMEPAPNYRHCTDPGDAQQLTDGIYSEGYFWTQPSTVGWQNARPVVITLDLGEVKPIRGVSYNTAAGRAGVEWPLAIHILVADEDKGFYEVGDLVALSANHGLPDPDEYATHRYWTDALRSHGRYVCFVVSAQPYGFTDEIEVYAGDPDWVSLPRTGTPVADIKARMDALAVDEGVKRRMREDIATVRERANDAAVPAGVRDAVLAELDAIEQGMAGLPIEYGEDFRAVLPLNPLHERVFGALARLWQGMGCAPVIVWQSGLWEPLSHLVEPIAAEDCAVRVHLMNNEYRAAAFNVTNAASERRTFSLNIAGLPGGSNPQYITVHEVAWTDTNSGQPVAAALPEASREDGAYRITVSSGMTRQVWLTFHPTDLAPRTHEGQVQLANGQDVLGIPLTLTVYPARFPDKPSLHFGGWDYVDCGARYGVTAENRDAFLEHLRAHFVDSPWATPGVMPRGQHDGAGAMVAEPDTANFDEWLRLWPDAPRYCVFVAVNNTFGEWPMSTAEFETAVKAWATFWAGYARGKGVEPTRLFLLLVDEPHDPAQDEVILAWAKAIRAANTGLNIWEDPIYGDMAEANQDMVAACHVLCPNRQIFVNAEQTYRDYFAEQRRNGITLEFYSCSGPAPLLDPYSYHRLQAWTCWREGATASYFWAFGDNAGASSWNEYRVPGNTYTPFFLDAGSVTAGKHMEACREGIEDYEYLVMLRDAIEKARRESGNADAIGRAEAVLAECPERVLESGASHVFRWREELDRTVADQARVQILDALLALQPPQ